MKHIYIYESYIYINKSYYCELKYHNIKDDQYDLFYLIRFDVVINQLILLLISYGYNSAATKS